MDTQEEILITRACKGDVEAFAQLYQDVYKDLFRFALYTLGDPADAEDVVSDTVADAFATIHKLRNASAFRSWIFKILTNKCKMVLKCYTQRPYELDSEIHMPDRNYAEIQDVRNAFAKLSTNERFILSLTVFAGYSNEEAAKILHIKSGTLRSIKSRAMDKMEADLSVS